MQRPGRQVKRHPPECSWERARSSAEHSVPDNVWVYSFGVGPAPSHHTLWLMKAQAYSGLFAPHNGIFSFPNNGSVWEQVFADPAKIQSELNWTARFTDLKEGMATAWRCARASLTRVNSQRPSIEILQGRNVASD